jgi:putative protein kinase ArgK-like GTPase of G3E family
VDEVWKAARDHKAFLDSTGLLVERRKQKIQAELAELVAEIARTNLKNSMESSAAVQKILLEVVDHKMDPHSAAEGLVKDLFKPSTG